MSGSGGEDHDVAAVQLEYLAPIAPEPYAGVSARNAEHFMGARMVMHVIIDAVAPGVSPAIALEQFLECRCGIAGIGKPQGAAIMDERELRIVWNRPIIPEHGLVRLAFVDSFPHGACGGSSDPGDGFKRLFQCFQQVHDLPSALPVNPLAGPKFRCNVAPVALTRGGRFSCWQAK